MLDHLEISFIPYKGSIARTKYHASDLTRALVEEKLKYRVAVTRSELFAIQQNCKTLTQWYTKLLRTSNPAIKNQISSTASSLGALFEL